MCRHCEIVCHSKCNSKGTTDIRASLCATCARMPFSIKSRKVECKVCKRSSPPSSTNKKQKHFVCNTYQSGTIQSKCSLCSHTSG